MASRSRYWLLTGEVSRSCLHCSRTCRVRTLNVSMTVIMSLFYVDVTKVVRSPGCDPGRDEESRNGRDVKIDILEAYVWTSERFRAKTGIYRSTGRLPEPPGDLMGHMGLGRREERRQKGLAGAPSPLAPLYTEAEAH